MEPATPITITTQMFRPNMICKKTMMVKAGGKGNGTTSNKKAPIKTNRYCHYIFLTFYNHIIKEKNMEYFFNLTSLVLNLL